MLLGMALLATYGVTVDQVRWDFARLLGVYVAVFAAVSVLAGRLVFAEQVPLSSWLGLALILSGGAVMQFASRRARLDGSSAGPYYEPTRITQLCCTMRNRR